MNSHTLSDAISRMAWIDRVAKPVQVAIGSFYKKTGGFGKAMEGFLHGKFIGHPLHPAMVHLPLGCFVLAAITDLFSFNPTAASVSSVAIWVGVIAMVPAALSGSTDWYPYGDASVRRIGGLHMMLNVTALLLYVASIACRASGLWGLGVFFGYVAFFGLMFSGYLGGLLVYEKQIGTYHAPQPEDEAAPNEFIPVIALEKLAEQKPTKVRVRDVAIVLVRSEDQVFAMANLCAHEGGPLSEGELEDGCLICPWHQSKFALSDGSVKDGPSVYPQPVFPTRVRHGMVEVLAVRQVEPVSYPTPYGTASMR